MAKKYSMERRESPIETYLKVFLADQDCIEPVATFIGKLKQVRTCGITQSSSAAHPGNTLTVYCKPMFDIDELEQSVKAALDNYFSDVTIIPEQTVTEASFTAIESRILEQLNAAVNTIYVCVAWFTNDKFRKILEDKQKEGVDVKVIINKDGVNADKGVDLGNIEHKEMRSEHGGIMHNKYCIIDNHVVINGSYNWTSNAELRNDENITVVQNWENANSFTREFREMWNRK